MNSLNIHPNLLPRLAALRSPPTATMEDLNALERVLLAAAVVGDVPRLGALVAQYAELTGGSAMSAINPGEGWLTDFYLLAADRTPVPDLIAHITNALGHGDADGLLSEVKSDFIVRYEWNTGRMYTREGQIIVAYIFTAEPNVVVFRDHSRHISGKFTIATENPTPEGLEGLVMDAYDRNAYECCQDHPSLVIRNLK